MIRKYVLLMILIVFTLSACTQVHDTGEETDNAQEEIAYNTEYLTYVTIDDGYCITACAEYSGAEYQYVVYELEDKDSEYSPEIYWVVVVLKDKKVLSVLRQELLVYEELNRATISNLVLEKDVNFDGKNDILLWLGHFGNQGLIRYACYLNIDDEFVECPSFSEIANPAVDEANQVVLSSWRNWAASHSWAMYYLIDGEYTETERLTEEPIFTEDDEELWTWTDEIFVDGEWQIREYFTQNDYDEETLYGEKVYGEGCHWDIGQDRWRTLFNNGMMSDYSIYSSEWVETG